MLSKKYYIKIAEILASSNSVDEVRNKLAEFFKKDNEFFDKEKFLKKSKEERII